MDTALLEDFTYRDWDVDTSGTVRFALVGLGWWTTEKVIPAIQATDTCTTTAVVSGGQEKRDRLVEKYDSIETGLSYEAFTDGVGADRYDAVYVCTPNALHLKYVDSAVTMGKDVLVEKPMEASVERARDLVMAAQQAEDVTVMVGYRMHTEPTVRYARTLIRKGVIGEPKLVHGEMSQTLLTVFDDPDQWRLNPDLTGYGTSVMDLGIYSLNTTRFLLDADPIATQATMASSHEAFDTVEDEVAVFTVAYDNGVHGSFSASQNASETSRLEIVGDTGRIALEPAFHGESELVVGTGDITVDVDLPAVDQMEEEFAYFSTKVLADHPVYADGEHGLVDLETIEAIHRSAETGERVEVTADH